MMSSTQGVQILSCALSDTPGLPGAEKFLSTSNCVYSTLLLRTHIISHPHLHRPYHVDPISDVEYATMTSQPSGLE